MAEEGGAATIEDYDFSGTTAGASDVFPSEAGQIKKGGYIMIKGRPCKVVNVSTSKTGKHGHAKANFTAIDIFNGKKVEDVVPTTHTTYVPNVNRSEYQLLDIEDGFVSLLKEDGETRDDLKLPDYPEGFDQEILKAYEDGKSLSISVLSACGIDQIIAYKVRFCFCGGAGLVGHARACDSSTLSLSLYPIHHRRTLKQEPAAAANVCVHSLIGAGGEQPGWRRRRRRKISEEDTEQACTLGAESTTKGRCEPCLSLGRDMCVVCTRGVVGPSFIFVSGCGTGREEGRETEDGLENIATKTKKKQRGKNHITPRCSFRVICLRPSIHTHAQSSIFPFHRNSSHL